MQEKVDTEIRNDFLSEAEMAYILQQQLEQLGYVVVRELVLTDKQFNLKEKTGKKISKIRIDVAAYKDEQVTFIEVENGLWLTHPLLYREFADYLLLAYPEEYSSPTDQEQIKLAKLYGIGIITVANNGSTKSLLRPEKQSLSPMISKAIISLITKRTK